MLVIGLLGAHRICVRRTFDRAQAKRGRWNGDVGFGSNILCDDIAGGGTKQISGPKRGNHGVFSPRREHLGFCAAGVSLVPMQEGPVVFEFCR
jgi:hypothetical protein